MLELNYEGFDGLQTEAIEYAFFTVGLTEQEMECVARKEYPACLMYSILEVFEDNEGDDVLEFFKTNFEPYINFDKFSVDQICKILEGLQNGLTPEEVDLYAKAVYSDLQMDVIMEGLLLGLNMDEVSKFAEPEFTPEEMEDKMYMLLAK